MDTFSRFSPSPSKNLFIFVPVESFGNYHQLFTFPLPHYRSKKRRRPLTGKDKQETLKNTQNNPLTKTKTTYGFRTINSLLECLRGQSGQRQVGDSRHLVCTARRQYVEHLHRHQRSIQSFRHTYPGTRRGPSVRTQPFGT